MIVADCINDLANKFKMGRLSHAFLVETNDIEKCLCDIKELIKIINCIEVYNTNCEKKCNLCKLIDLNNLPSVLIIRPDGMSIKKSQMQELQEKFGMKPVYSKYNTYIVTNADLLNSSAANSILKFLEEPEDYIIGFYITTNKENIIDTIKSRCQIIKAFYETAKEDDAIKNIALEYIDRIKNGCGLYVNKEYVLSVIKERAEINKMFIFLLDEFTNKLKENYFPGNNLKIEIIKKQVAIIEKMLHLNQYNVNLELLLDRFVIEMRRTYV